MKYNPVEYRDIQSNVGQAVEGLMQDGQTDPYLRLNIDQVARREPTELLLGGRAVAVAQVVMLHPGVTVRRGEGDMHTQLWIPLGADRDGRFVQRAGLLEWKDENNLAAQTSDSRDPDVYHRVMRGDYAHIGWGSVAVAGWFETYDNGYEVERTLADRGVRFGEKWELSNRTEDPQVGLGIKVTDESNFSAIPPFRARILPS